MKKRADIMVGLLVLQFVLGMLANLYSTVPKHKPYEVFNHFGFIIFHALNGFALLALAVIFIIKARKAKIFTEQARGGLGSIVSAIIFGELFVFTQKDIFSLFMAISFIGALLNYSKVAFSGTNIKETKKIRN